MLTALLAGLWVLATSSPLGPILIAIIGALGAGVGGSLLIAGPQRRNIAEEATGKAIESIDRVRESLEKRLNAVENELVEARARITELEKELALARAERGEAVARLERERDRLKRQVEDLSVEVNDFRRRLPGKRTRDKQPRPPTDDEDRP